MRFKALSLSLSLSLVSYTQLDAADSNKKNIFPILYEDVDFSSEAGKRIQLVIGGIQYIKCRPNLDDCSDSVYWLMQSLKKKGVCVCVCVPN